ncbi:MAG: response regulator [Paracoccaceae bacterium]
MTQDKIRVVMADDHQMFLQGLERLLQSDPRLDVVATAADGDALLEIVKQTEPDLAIIDISMPGPGPAGIVEALELRGARTRTLALTMHFEPSYARELLANGMNGYVIKEAAFDELIDAIVTVHGGDQYLSRDLVEKAPVETLLTDRERACLTAAAQGMTAKMTARHLEITERTVRFHSANACRKLGVQRVTEAVAAALKANLIQT